MKPLHWKLSRGLPWVLLWLGVSGCIDTGLEETTVDLSVSGNADAIRFEGRSGERVMLDRAEVAFGPLYLCTGTTAGELCEEAVAEWRDAVVVDGLDGAEVGVGTMVARTATARSYMYDLGIVSRLTTPTMPLVLPAAEELGRASASVDGTVEVAGQVVFFTVVVRVEQTGEVEQGVPVVRSGTTDGFEQRLAQDGDTGLTVRFDPRDWLATADFASLVEDDVCAPGRAIVCAGSVEQLCDDGGTLADSRDCADDGEVCVRDVGCVAHLNLGDESQIGRAMRNGLAAGSRPAFEFHTP